MPLVTDSPSGATVTVRVTPRAGRTEVAGISGDQLLVRIAAAPVDDVANRVLVELLARTLDVPKRSIQIASGLRGRTKRLTVANLSAGEVERRLGAALK
ncbi:MAG TPA: DUF167 domain-containing protein [Vicinamibacterales bacterium]|nr:DUF167 domain-containing protein [Vicinamibacterales bacterium]